MSFDLILRGGTVVLPDTHGVPADIAIKDERIAAILAPGTEAQARETVDVSGKTVLPGAIDVHLHLGPGKDIARPRMPPTATSSRPPTRRLSRSSTPRPMAGRRAARCPRT